MSKLEVGQIYDGVVTKVMPFGAFVKLPDGQSGMVHISEVSTGFVKDINEVCHEGMETKVKLVSIADDGKIALSIKQTMPKPQSRPKPRTFNGGFESKKEAPKDFEDMMSSFMKKSDEKISDLNRATKQKQGARKRK